jgi:membrane associated rhomboid family serine protease
MTEFRPSSFQILPTVIKNLLIINGLFFLAQKTIGPQINMDDLFALHTWQSPLFKPWQFITHMFMHGNLGHIFSNMFALWMFGSILENLWGPKRFLTFYISCGLGAALAHMIVLYFQMQPVVEAFNLLSYEQQQQILHDPNFRLNEATLGASGAVFGCLAAFGYLFPNTKIYLYFMATSIFIWITTFY